MSPVHAIAVALLALILVALVVAVTLRWRARRRRDEDRLRRDESGAVEARLARAAELAPGTAVVPGAPAVHPVPRIHPIVLVHGVLGFDHIAVLGRRIVYFRGVADLLREHGITVYTARLPAFSSVPDRALALARFVRELPCEHVNIVAHSMGGLDSRYAISRLGLDDKAVSLITIATPHRGTPLADLMAGVGGLRPMRALRAMVGRVGLDTAAVDWLTTGRTGFLNRAIVDVGGVLYGSIVGRAQRSAIRSNPVLLSGHAYILGRAGENDGMVPMSSQHWGELLAEVDADHWAQIGWSSYFDAGAIYRRLLADLRRRGL